MKVVGYGVRVCVCVWSCSIKMMKMVVRDGIIRINRELQGVYTG